MKTGSKLVALILAVMLTLSLCTAASAETITLKIAHNYDFVTIPNAVIAAGERLNERYAADPNPQPARKGAQRQQPDRADDGKKTVRRAVQPPAQRAFSMKPPRQMAVQHIAQAAQRIDNPKCRPLHVKSDQRRRAQHTQQRQ